MDYYYDYNYGVDSSLDSTSALAFGGTTMLFVSAIGIFNLITTWITFKKANKPGWAAIVPIYNIIVMLEIAELPMWYIALFFVPFANIYALFKINIEIAKKFGKSTGFGVGMTLFAVIFWAILAFDKNAKYLGSNNTNTTTTDMNNQMNQNVQTQNQQLKFCPNCGKQVNVTSEFCPNCGSKVM